MKESHEKSYAYLTTGKIMSLITGYIIFFGLTRLLGPENFGIYGIVIGLVSIINMVVIIGTVQSISKFISEKESLAEVIKRTGLKVQLFLGGGLFLAFFLLADVIANLLNDPSLTPFIRLASLIIISYSFYAVFIGYLNGLKRFKKQALFDIFYSIIKTISILTLAFIGVSTFYAIGGFALAAFIIFITSLIFVGFKKSSGTFNYKKILSFEIFIMIYTLLVNLILNTDLFLLKALSNPEVSNLLSGYYTTALSLARLPYFAVISLTLLIFPLISKSTFNQDSIRTRSYINNAMRFTLLLVVLLAVLISSNANEFINLLYSSEFLPAGEPLAILVFGLMFFALTIVGSTIISASGKPKTSLYIMGVILIINVFLNFILIPRFSMLGAAVAATISLFIGFLIVALYLLNKFGALIKYKSLSRIILAGIITYFIGTLFVLTGILSLAKAAILGIIYLLILFITKEFTRKDYRRIRRLVKI